CPVCGGDHKCALGEDGAILCGRRKGPQSGFRDCGPARNDPTWNVYRRDDGLPGRNGNGKAHGNEGWPARARRYAGQLTAGRRFDLAAALGLPVECLAALPLTGSINHPDPDLGSCWTFPEVDGAGRIIGIGLRTAHGRKKTMKGSKRGLTVPDGWRDRAGPLVI